MVPGHRAEVVLFFLNITARTRTGMPVHESHIKYHSYLTATYLRAAKFVPRPPPPRNSPPPPHCIALSQRSPHQVPWTFAPFFLFFSSPTAGGGGNGGGAGGDGILAGAKRGRSVSARLERDTRFTCVSLSRNNRLTRPCACLEFSTSASARGWVACPCVTRVLVWLYSGFCSCYRGLSLRAQA